MKKTKKRIAIENCVLCGVLNSYQHKEHKNELDTLIKETSANFYEYCHYRTIYDIDRLARYHKNWIEVSFDQKFKNEVAEKISECLDVYYKK